MDKFFTPERIAELDATSEEIAAGGRTYTIDEVRAHSEARYANGL